MERIKVKFLDGRAQLYTPYSRNFISTLKGTIGGAKWNAEEKYWSIPADKIEVARKIMVDVYGESDIPEMTSRLRIRIRFLEDYGVTCGPITLFGRPICTARHRDSGAVPCDGVTLIEGEIDSGGSMKNWRTIAYEGAVLEISDVPQAAYEKCKRLEGKVFEFESIESELSDNEKVAAELSMLREYRAKIDARIAELEAMFPA